MSLSRVLLSVLLTGVVAGASFGDETKAAATPSVVLLAAKDSNNFVAENATIESTPDAITFTPKSAGDVIVQIAIPSAARNLGDYLNVSFTVESQASRNLTIKAAAMNDGSTARKDRVDGLGELSAKQSGDVSVKLVRRPVDPTYEPFKPFFMYYDGMTVRDGTVDPTAVAKLELRYEASGPDDKIVIRQISATGKGDSASVPFLPFIDEIGQYIHADWPGKVQGPEQFEYWKNLEAQKLKEYKAPEGWDEFGGFAKGAKQKATGHFYAAKVDGKWWLVDPIGNLFFSYGPTGVGFGDHSPYTERENWFTKLPPKDGPFGRFYEAGSNARYRFYQNKKFDMFNFAEANLLRKYGEDYVKTICELSHKRMHSWGFNTIGNWSDDRICALKQTPYVVAIHAGNLDLGHHKDVFDPNFGPILRKRMEKERETTAGDQYNIGYFVDNELEWGPQADGANVARRALTMGAKQPSKIEFIKDLQAKYQDIGKLNDQWKTTYASWEEVSESKTPPELKNEGAMVDYRAFGLKFAEQYFKICRDEVKRVAPDNMYLGCRFHGHIDVGLMKVAAKYADAVGYNIYDRDPTGRLNQYKNVDCPIIVGEFGIESDYVQTPFRGKVTEDADWTPRKRTQRLEDYMNRAMNHPLLVGAHFFQYLDQPISGRPDGEAILRGFVNIADTPNFLLIESNRGIANSIYPSRSGQK